MDFTMFDLKIKKVMSLINTYCCEWNPMLDENEDIECMWEKFKIYKVKLKTGMFQHATSSRQ